ncbi:MAG: hypothetical protein MJ233_04270 [Mycoplasmoidaceae bacterium]|nr:hypothetical protein [Mycoplasmoidaceae bacterium]
MLANIKSDFISKVFATSYFGVAKAAPSNEGTLYPHIFTEASTDVSRFNLNDPTL